MYRIVTPRATAPLMVCRHILASILLRPRSVLSV